jgi:hypothetical protein
MIEPIVGSRNAERVLLFLVARDEGYATEIARFFGTDLYGVQLQLDRLEAGGVLVSRRFGRTRVYSFSPNYPFLREVKDLVRKALTLSPQEMRDELLLNRRRPRRRGKPL